MLPEEFGGIAPAAKRVAIVLAALLLSACAAGPRTGVAAFERVPPSSVSSVMLSPVSVAVAPLPGDTVTLLDSRVLRALRRTAADGEALGLTRGQKVALWVGVTVVAAYLVAEWIEDEVAFVQ